MYINLVLHEVNIRCFFFKFGCIKGHASPPPALIVSALPRRFSSSFKIHYISFPFNLLSALIKAVIIIIHFVHVSVYVFMLPGRSSYPRLAFGLDLVNLRKRNCENCWTVTYLYCHCRCTVRRRVPKGIGAMYLHVLKMVNYVKYILLVYK